MGMVAIFRVSYAEVIADTTDRMIRTRFFLHEGLLGALDIFVKQVYS